MRRAAALGLALALAGSGCGGRQLTNRQLAAGAVGVVAVLGVIVLVSLVSDCGARRGERAAIPTATPQPRARSDGLAAGQNGALNSSDAKLPTTGEPSDVPPAENVISPPSSTPRMSAVPVEMW